MRNWKITGFIATIVIVLSIPGYVLKEKYISRNLYDKKAHTASFVGEKECISCHKEEHKKWLGSDHDNAMDVATEKTVLGDFDNVSFKHNGTTSRFYKKNKKFYVYTMGPKGEMGDFEIRYTFGVTPLQQYLVPFEGGRLQCLPIAWDVEKKGWYHLYPDEKIDPKEWLYWTNAGQNWNGMCSECHSTNLKKGYNTISKTYNTTWSEINISCESCHGPGSLHVEWADKPEMGRSTVDKSYGLVVRTDNMDSKKMVGLCARCHSRRSLLGNYNHLNNEMMDNMVPELLTEPLYYPDGQILDEVYVYGSFVQSKMYNKDVGCKDCHDVHSGKIVKDDNALCLQCHRADIYDTKNHHFHKKKGEKGDPVKVKDFVSEVGEGAECIKCHMPGKYYMGIDYRPDHSIRIPRPDLSIRLKTPNACNRCHIDKTNEWSDEYVTKWYGIGRRPHYGTILAKGRTETTGDQSDLIGLADNQLFPVVVRATALSYVNSYRDKEGSDLYKRAFLDEHPLIRYTAVRNFNHPDINERIKIIAPMLYDTVRAVRMEAAMNLTVVPEKELDVHQEKAFKAALSEYKAAMEYSSDFTFSGLNLGNMYSNLGNNDMAEKKYKEAFGISDEFYPAKVNLAILYNDMGKNNEAEKLLREVVENHPESYEIAYSLGLLLAEKNEYDDAARYIGQAAKGMPNEARIYYNLGLLLQYLEKTPDAENALLRAVEIEPDNIDFLYAAADFYIKRKQFLEARNIVEKIISSHPDVPIGNNLLKFINSRITP
ncbi:MAG: tetratricopeptide repeat protein [Desulfobacteraceae bacterium]|nr:tetratricopeptide repeat protein [Desulfobacteraceae bacterium]